jgi:hypothetical protein
MTEAEWLVCTDPQKMLEFLRGKTSERKLRLFACACCRRIWRLLTEEPSRRAVEVAELYADGSATRRLLQDVRDRAEGRASEARITAPSDPIARCLHLQATTAAWRVASLGWGRNGDHVSQLAALARAGQTAEPWTAGSFGQHVDADAVFGAAFRREREAHATLLHDLFGPQPFRPITLDPAWLSWHGGLLVSMARQMYQSRDFSDMPVLADALEEAGCTNQDILAHCRAGGEHVRGCWIVDLLSGKE